MASNRGAPVTVLCWSRGRGTHAVDDVRPPSAGERIWIDVSSRALGHVDAIVRELDLSPVDPTQPLRSRLAVHRTHVHLAVSWPTGDATVTVRLLLAPRLLLSVTPPDLAAIREVHRRVVSEDLLARGADFVLYQVLDAAIRGGIHRLDAMEMELDQLDTQLFEPRRREQFTARIFSLRRSVMRSRRAAAPLRDALALLSRGSVRMIAPKNEPFFLSLYDGALRWIDGLDTVRDALSGTLETQLNVQSNRLNEAVRFLTVVSTTFMPLTLITGVYGMNFRIPELRWGLGYPYVLALMTAVTALSLLYFRRQGWLRAAGSARGPAPAGGTGAAGTTDPVREGY